MQPVRAAASHAVTDVCVINLDRSRERWETFGKLNSSVIRFERFGAIEGVSQSRAALHASGILNQDVLYTDGAVGCALSHIALWKKATDENRNLTICEDDAVFNSEFTSRSEALLQQLDGKFDLILWGWNFDSVMSYQLLPGVSICAARFDQSRMRAAIDRFRALRFQPSLYRLARAFGTPCYTVSAQGARNLLDRCLPLRNMMVGFPGYDHKFPNNGIDVVMSALYPDLRAFVSLPPLALTPHDRSTSTTLPRDEVLRETIITTE